MTKYLNIIPLLAILLLCSCNTEESTFTPSQESSQITAALTGVVLDINEAPIQDAEIFYNGKSTRSNSSGIYELKNITVDSKHNKVTVTKDGYLESVITFRTSSSERIFHKTTMVEKKYEYEFQSSEGSTISTDKIMVAFAPNSIMYSSNKVAYDGTVRVAVSYLDPTDPEFGNKMPGDLTAITTENILHKSTSFGMAYVSLISPSGELLQIKEGSVATLSLEVPDELVSSIPDIVDASHFDEDIGLWKQETKASRSGNILTSEVSHFSWWSFNVSSPAIVLTGRVVDQNGLPIEGFQYQISQTNDWTTSYGLTDADGIFTATVTQDESQWIYIYASTYCPGQPFLLSTNVGPFATDTNIGDLVVDISDMVMLSVEATFLNCDNEPVTNGIAKVGPIYVQITDGTVSVNTPVCESTLNYILWAHDLDTDRVSEILPLTLGQVNSYLDYSLCTIEARYVTVFAPGLGISDTTMVEIGAGYDGLDKSIFILYNTDSSTELAQMEIEYSDDEASGFKIGTWPISDATIIIGAFSQVLSYSADLGDGEITITEVGTDALSNYIKGTYRIDFEDVNTGVSYEFTGDFNLRTN